MGSSISLGLCSPNSVCEGLQPWGSHSGFKHDSRVGEVLGVVRARGMLNFFEIGGFQRVIGPLIWINEVQFGFGIL